MLSWPAALHQLQLGRTPSSLFCQNKRRKKNQWKGSSSGVGLSPSFRVAEAGSPRPPLWHVPRAPLPLRHRVLGPAGASSTRAGRREEAAVLRLRSGSQTARTSLALQSIASVWGKLKPPWELGKTCISLVFLHLCRASGVTDQAETHPAWKIEGKPQRCSGEGILEGNSKSSMKQRVKVSSGAICVCSPAAGEQPGVEGPKAPLVGRNEALGSRPEGDGGDVTHRN